jgi:hypothetical protein
LVVSNVSSRREPSVFVRFANRLQHASLTP